MKRLGLAFSTKDRVPLSRVSILPLLQPDNFSLFWTDGSTSEEGKKLPYAVSLESGEGHGINVQAGVRGGADAAIVYNLTTLLACQDFEYVGLIENDVLLDPDWFEPTMALFEAGRRDGLDVGAVSARAYEDRVLCQRDGYALMHNLGAGMVILTRQAAYLILQHFRTSWSTDNRIVFNQLSGVDIGRYWAFRGNPQFITADWGFDAILASHGLASLALTPAKCRMIGQDPPLEQQGLRLVEEPVEALRDDAAFDLYVKRTRQIREDFWLFSYPTQARHLGPDGVWTIFPHHLAAMGAVFEGDWRLRWAQGFGPFAWRAGAAGATLTLPVSGVVEFLVGGGESGGQVEILDTRSGYKVTPMLAAESPTTQMMVLPVPAGVAYRDVRVTALAEGVTIFAVRTREPQPVRLDVAFDYRTLPPV